MRKAPAAKPTSAAAKEQRQKAEREALERVALERMMMLADEVKREYEETKIGKAEPIGSRFDWLGFCFPAHVWGYKMVRVTKEHMKQTMRGEGAWEAYKSTFEAQDRRKAYIVGYRTWFESGRAEAGTLLAQLRPYTVDPATRLSSSDAQFRRITGVALVDQASRAYVNWDAVVKRAKAAKVLAASAAAAAATPTPPSPPPPPPSLPSAPSSDGAGPSSAGRTPPLRTPLRTPPTQVAAADAAADDAAELVVPLEPEAPKDRYEAMVAFLESPGAWHTFDAGTTLMRRVEDAMQENRMFAVRGPLPGGMGAVAFQLLESVCTVVDDGDAEFGNLLRDYGFSDLLRSEAARAEPRDPANWPPRFAELQLNYVSHGGYNSVWAPKSGVDYGETLFPAEVVDSLTAGTVVLRAVIPKDNGSEWMTHSAALGEMTNMATAAHNGYGPRIAAMGWERRKRTSRVSGEMIDWYRLYAFLQRGTMDVDRRISQLRPETGPSLANLHGYFNRLLRAVWGYSSDRCVFVDAKLKNFVDTFPDHGPTLREGAKGVVRVIDLAGDGFRRMWMQPVVEGSDAHVTAQGWRLIWLHNVLVVSCSLRLNLPYDAYLALWWNKIHAAVLRVRAEFSQRRAYADDTEYATAAAFVRACKWHGPLYTGQWDATATYRPVGLPESVPGNDPATVAAECRKFATYYFHDVWHQYGFQNYAGVLRYQRRIGLDPNVRDAEKADAKAKADKARAMFDSYYVPKVVPMHRHFREHLSKSPDGAKPLVQVMYLYCKMTDRELHDRYVRGTGDLLVWRWPPVSTSKQQQREPAAHEVRDARYWNRRMGFEYL